MLKPLALALLLSTPAAAATLDVFVPGTLIAQNNDGADANLAVGSTFALTASFDTALLIPWGDTGYSIAGLYGLPADSFRVDAGGLFWQAADSPDDGASPFYKTATARESFPAIILQGDKVVGLVGNLSPAGNRAPVLGLGSTLSGGAPGNFAMPVLTSYFGIGGAGCLWGNCYSTPGFTGLWDFANATAVDPPDATAAVPEPAAWALLIVGFAAVGFVMRRKRLAPAW